MVNLEFYISQNPFFLIGSFLLGFVLPYLIFYHIKESTGNTLLTLALASFVFGIIYQFQDILFKTVPLHASLFYLGFWAAIFLAIIKGGTKAVIKIGSYTSGLLKEMNLEGKLIKGIKKLTREEKNIIKKESKYIKAIKKQINEAIEWFERESIRKSLEHIRKAIDIIDSIIEYFEKLTYEEKEEEKEIEKLEKVEEEELKEEEAEGKILRHLGKFLSKFDKKEELLDIYEEKIEESIRKLDEKELYDISNLLKELQSIKRLLYILYNYVRYSNIEGIRVTLLQIKRILNEIERFYGGLLRDLKMEEKLEKQLEKLVKEESKIEKIKRKLIKKQERRLPKI